MKGEPGREVSRARKLLPVLSSWAKLKPLLARHWVMLASSPGARETGSRTCRKVSPRWLAAPGCVATSRMRRRTRPGAPQRAATCRAVLPSPSRLLTSTAVQVNASAGLPCVRTALIRWWMHQNVLLQQNRTSSWFSSV